MFCPSCGAESSKNVVFCSRCGKPLQRTNRRTHLILAVLGVFVLVLVLLGTLGITSYLTHSTSQNTVQITNNVVKTEIPTPTDTRPRASTPIPTTAPRLASHSTPINIVPSSYTDQYNQGYNAGWSKADADIFTFISLSCSPIATVYLSGYGQQWGQIDCNISGSSHTLFYNDNYYSQYGRYWDGARLGYKDRMDKLWNYMWGNCRATSAIVNYSTDSSGTHVTCSPN